MPSNPTTLPPIGARVTVHQFGVHRGVVTEHEPEVVLQSGARSCIPDWVRVVLDDGRTWSGAAHDGFGFQVVADQYVKLDPSEPKGSAGEVIVDLEECFPEQPEEIVRVQAVLERDGWCRVGGGAGPEFVIVRRPS